MRMLESLTIDKNQIGKIPDTPEGRITELMALPVKAKENFLPEPGLELRIGPYVYRVAIINPSQLRFTAKLVDVIIDGVNDGSEKVSDIIDPNTGEGIVR